MSEAVKHFGEALIIAIAVIALVVIIQALTGTTGDNAVVFNAFKSLINGFFDAANKAGGITDMWTTPTT